MPRTKVPANVQTFVDHLSHGLNMAEFDIDKFYPCWVKHNETKENGFLFMQSEGERDTAVTVFQDRIEFLDSHVSLIMNNELTPAKAAIMFLVAIIQGNVITPPECPCCAEEGAK